MDTDMDMVRISNLFIRAINEGIKISLIFLSGRLDRISLVNSPNE